MFYNGVAASAVAATALVASAFVTSAQPTDTDGAFELAQQDCGWYAISVCSQRGGVARRGVDRYGGYVVDTNDVANFRPGFFCAVVGPTSKRRAEERMFEMQDAGASSAYIKRGCPLSG